MRLLLQSLIFEKFGVTANDLEDGDSGVEGRGVRVDDPFVVPWVACAIIHPAPFIPGSPPLASSLGVLVSEPQPPVFWLWPVSLARLQLASFLGQPDGTMAGICRPWFLFLPMNLTLDPGPDLRVPSEGRQVNVDQMW